MMCVTGGNNEGGESLPFFLLFPCKLGAWRLEYALRGLALGE